METAQFQTNFAVPRTWSTRTVQWMLCSMNTVCIWINFLFDTAVILMKSCFLRLCMVLL